MMPRDEVVRHALDLDRDDRVYLIEALEHSLTLAPFTTRDFSAAWAAEIERRLTAYKRGEITAGEMRSAIEPAGPRPAPAVIEPAASPPALLLEKRTGKRGRSSFQKRVASPFQCRPLFSARCVPFLAPSSR